MTDFLAEQVQSLRTLHPEMCCRPNNKFTHVCIRDIGHKGKCGWDGADSKRRKDESANLQQLWTQQRLPFPNSFTQPVYESPLFSPRGSTGTSGGSEGATISRTSRAVHAAFIEKGRAEGFGRSIPEYGFVFPMPEKDSNP